MWWVNAMRFVLLLAVGLNAVFGDEDETPTSLSIYNVTMKIKSRLAETTILMVFENPQLCSSIYTLTLQLPRNARLTSLEMEHSDGCKLGSVVKGLEAAIQDFEEQSSQGMAAALLTAWDITNYGLQVSLPPNGTSFVEIRYEELLWQKLNKVAFQIPVFPGLPVAELFMNIEIEDSDSGILGFDVEDLDDVNITMGETLSRAQYEVYQVSDQDSLPTLVRAYYEPGPLSDEGIFLSNGQCFSHIFNPSAFLVTAGSMARKIIFVIDVSGSMQGQKLDDAKEAFVAMIETLNSDDILLVQTFSSSGTEDLWGPKAATSSEKESARNFVSRLETIGNTNLNDAFLEAIERVHDTEADVVSILVILTDGRGDTSPIETARNVRSKNQDGKVKIFSLAFGDDADMDLLLGISIQNGGRTTKIYEGFGDATTQMELFYRSELGTILLADIDVVYESGDILIRDATISNFPVLAEGSEIVVRGMLEQTGDTVSSREGSTPILRSVVSALSSVGPQMWSTNHTIESRSSFRVSECFQSFSQARILELLEYRDAERSLGDELFDIPTSRSTSTYEKQAQDLAIDAGLVWPGLTAMVTVENDLCSMIYDVCPQRDSNGDGYGDDSQSEAGLSPASPTLSASDTAGSSYGSGGMTATLYGSSSCDQKISLMSILFSIIVICLALDLHLP